MSSLISSFSDANIGLFQDAYDLWYQQGVHFYDYGQHQQSDRPADAQRPIEPSQPQEHYDSYDRTLGNMLQNHLPPSTAQPSRDQPQKAPQNRKMHVLTKDTNGKSDRNRETVFRRRPGACTRCKQVKMKCDFALGEQTCQRCKSKGCHCVVEAPKPKVYERERLLTEIRQKDAIIERLLKEFHNPYLATPHSIQEYAKSISTSDANNPGVLTWLDRLESSIQIDRGNSKETSIEAPGRLLHDQHLFAPSKVPQHKEMSTLTSKDSHSPVQFRPECEAQEITPRPDFRPGSSMGLGSPEILVLGIVTLEDAEQLFDIFYTYIHPFVAVLDPVLLTPKSTLARSPVLFTVICAIASRYHPHKSSIYQIAMHFAKHSAANALVLDEMKSIELCQAYILMSIYNTPERSWDRDQTWLYTGLAINIATALRLDHTQKINLATEKEEREHLNIARVWQACHLLDQASAIQLGKSSMMREESHMIIRHLGEWYRQSQYNLDYDVLLCGYNALVCVVARFYQEVLLDRSGLINSERVNLRDITMRYDVEIEISREEWKKKLTAGGVYHGAMFKHRQLHFHICYYKLVIFSFGFRQVFHAGIEAWYDYFFTKCFEYAKSVIRCMNEDLASGSMRYAPGHHFMCAAFAVVFLFKLLRPEFSSLLDKTDKDESIRLIGILIDRFNSSDIAIDDRHTPKLYARFLATVLNKYQHSSHDPAFEGSQTVLPGNTGTSMGSAENTDKESSDNCQKSYIARGYDSASSVSWPEATHARSSWPTQSRSDADLLHTMNESQNINGNCWAEGQPGNIEDEMFVSMSQNFDNPEWLQGILMPGFTWDFSARSQSENDAVSESNHYEMIRQV